MDFIHPPTIQTAQNLLGVQLIYEAPEITYSGYIVETEAYLGFKDQAAHGYQGRRTPKVESLYQQGGTIYAHVMTVTCSSILLHKNKVFQKAYLSVLFNLKQALK